MENENSFRRNRSIISQILTTHRTLEGVQIKKKLEATQLFVYLFKAFDSIYKSKMDQNTSRPLPLQRNCGSHNGAI